MYPGAVTLMIPRMILVIIFLSLLIFCLSIFLIGHDRSRPITGCRKFLCSFVLKWITIVMCVVCWFTYMGYDYLTLEDVNHYQEFLGPLEE